MEIFFIIGASSGIGQALALKLANAGNNVFGTFNKNEIQSDHPLIKYHQLNVLTENFLLDLQKPLWRLYCLILSRKKKQMLIGIL